MNKVILMGRLTRDPEVRYAQNENSTAVARYSLAVDHRFKREGEQDADFIGCVAFGRAAEFAEKWLHKGSKVVVPEGFRLEATPTRTVRKFTLPMLSSRSRRSQKARLPAKGNGGGYSGGGSNNSSSGDGFMNVPDGIDEELPFN